MKRPVLIVTRKDYDLHAAAVAEALEKRRIDVAWWDPGDIAHHRTSFTPASGCALASGWSVGGLAPETSLDAVRSVWLRRPNSFSLPMGIDPDYAGVVAEEWKYLRIGIWEALRRAGIPLVSDPDAIRRAEAKTAQLALAHDAGLTVPDTLITNDHEAFLAFCDKHDGALVFKKLRSHSIIAPSGAALFATKLLESPAQIAPGELALCPVIFQQVVESRLDCRILVVGNSVYGFKMHTRESENIGLDYRADIQSMKAVKHEYYDPPEAVSRACVMMCRAFGLNFGAFDFAIDADGRHVFFELNANGQWLWLQIATGFPLTDRIALFLAEGAAASNPAAVNQSEAWRYATALPA